MTDLHIKGDARRLAAMGRPRVHEWPRRLARRFTLRQIIALMAALAIVAVVLVVGLMAINERRVLYHEALDHAEQSSAFLADHAKRLFEVSDLVLHTAGTSLNGLSWDEIERSDDIRGSLRRMDDMLPYVDTVFAADATGLVRTSTLANAAPYSIADRSVFREAARAPTTGLLIGEPIIGRMTRRLTFIVGRPKTTPAGTFDGLVGVAMSLSYFPDYWKTLDKRNDEQIALVRADGAILARYPEATAGTRDSELGASLAAAVATGDRSASFSPGPHLFGRYHGVGDLPVYIAVVFSDQLIISRWWRALGDRLPPALVVMLAVVLMILLALRLARREEAARRQIESARAVLSAANTRLEQRVAERTADLVESNREIQRFAYIVSHDLRAPLVNIMGFTSELQGLRDDLLGPADPGARPQLVADYDEAIGFIKSSIDKMDRLIKAILSLSRQGQRVFKPEPLDMDALMQSIVDGVAHRVQTSGVTITVAPLPAIAADKVAVEQVFANLIDNAVKYLRPDVPGVIAIGGTASTTTATVTITDNGRGIGPQDHERVFELFRRAGKQDQPGEGIGLANVRSLIRRLQGTITLDSRVGLGCVFTVTLPRMAETSGADEHE